MLKWVGWFALALFVGYIALYLWQEYQLAQSVAH